MQRVAELGCALCRRLGTPGTPAVLHHPRSGVGMGQRASHMDVIPLCHEHHAGDTGIHALGRSFHERYGCTEHDLLNDTRQLLA